MRFFTTPLVVPKVPKVPVQPPVVRASSSLSAGSFIRASSAFLVFQIIYVYKERAGHGHGHGGRGYMNMRSPESDGVVSTCINTAASLKAFKQMKRFIQDIHVHVHVPVLILHGLNLDLNKLLLLKGQGRNQGQGQGQGQDQGLHHHKHQNVILATSAMERSDGDTFTRRYSTPSVSERPQSSLSSSSSSSSCMSTPTPTPGPTSSFHDHNDNDNDNDNVAALSAIMGETLFELREMREDIMGLREEMQTLKQEFKEYKRKVKSSMGMHIDDDDEEENEKEKEKENENDHRSYGNDGDDEEVIQSDKYPKRDEMQTVQLSAMEQKERMMEFQTIAQDVEQWAHHILFEQEGEEYENGWREIKCHKMVRNKFNRNGSTTCYVKWLKDPRGKYATLDNDESKEYPCIKCYTTMNAPIEDVCEYLSQEAHMAEYNDLVVAYRDLEDITPQSKITWSQCPQLLFIKPRDFVTFCHHRWREDGTQIVVSQACDHVDAPGNHIQSVHDADDYNHDGVCRAYSLRGANFISRDPTDPKNKTRVAILAHAHAGGGIPQWAMKAAVNAMAPIEPFKLFSRIEEKVIAYSNNLPPVDQRREDVVNTTHNSATTATTATTITGQSPRPAGLSQLGYACFWPNGGGGIGQEKPLNE